MDSRIAKIIDEFMVEPDLANDALDFFSVSLYKLEQLCNENIFPYLDDMAQIRINHLLEHEILDCLQSYKAIPIDVRNKPIKNYNNKTGKQIFMEQMHMINNKVDDIRNENTDTQSLLVMHEKLRNEVNYISPSGSLELSPKLEDNLITEEAKRFVQSYEGRRSLFEKPLPEVVQKDFLTPTKLLVYFVVFITSVCGLSLFI